MTIEADLRTYLVAQTPITDLVGARVFQDVADAGEITTETIVYELDDQDFRSNLKTQGTKPLSTFTVFCLAPSAVRRNALAEAVRNELSNYIGNMGSTATACLLTGRTDSSYKPDNGSDTWIYQAAFTLELNHTQSLPTGF